MEAELVPNQQVVSKKDSTQDEIRVPILVDYRNKTNMVLSLKQKVVVDTYIETQSIKACVEAVNKQFNRKVGPDAVKGWLDKNELVRMFVARRLEDKGFFNNWTKERYVRVLEAMAAGEKEVVFDDGMIFRFDKTSTFKLKLLGECLGYLKDSQSSGGINAQNVQINFTQADGKI